MRILLITATFPPSANGVSVAVKNTFEELKRQGHEVYVLAPENKLAGVDPEGVIRYPSLPNPLVPDYPIPLLPLTPKIMKTLSKVKFDIVHAQHPFQISFMADILAKYYKCPFVFTYHTRLDEYMKLYLKFLPQNITSKIAQYTGSGVLKKADLIIAPSRFIKSDLVARGVVKKIAVISAGIPKLARSKLSKNEVRKKYNLPSNVTILLCVSRLGIEKSVRLLLKSIKLLPESYHLVLVGTGPDAESLKDFAMSNDVSTKVTFVGKVDHSKVSDFYQLADVFAFPSVTETQGLVLLEAQYFGLPIVAADSLVNREWVPAKSGVIARSTAKSFSAAVLEVTKVGTKYSRSSSNFPQSFTLKKVTSDLVKVYSGLIRAENLKKPTTSFVKEKLTDLRTYVSNIIKNLS